MVDILFTHTYFYRFDAKQWQNKQPYPPYGTLYAAALMRESGFQVSLFDVALRASELEIAPEIERLQPRYLVIYDDGFNYLTKMCLTRMREAGFAMAKRAKAAGCTVIVNSSDSTDHFREYLAQGCDFVIHGEGEITLRELIFALDAGHTKPGHIEGISFTGESGIITTPPRPVLQQLDTLPDPAWDLADIDAYRQIWRKNHGTFSLNLATTRGCPYKCNWCAKPIYGNRYNSRSPERVAAEIERLIETHQVRHFWMADDIFGLKPRWVQTFRDIVKARGLRFSYKIQSRVDLLLQEDNIDALVESGLQEAWVGAESGSQKILDAMDKGTTIAEIRQATALLKQKGVNVCFFLQFGYLGETRADIDSTIQLMEELMPHDIGISVSYPLPGTKFYETVKNLLGEKQNWEVSDDLAMMYPGTFPPDFYRRLHRMVHKRFRFLQGRQAWRNLWQGKPWQMRRALKAFYYYPAWLIDRWRLKKLEKAK